jgi:uncharacterized NAD(P)/FAD-binding protein YdhS
MQRKMVAVIGAGFSGTLLALHLLRRCPPDVGVRLIERVPQFGRGPAYATGNPSHLLNVPAGRMSAFHDRPADFLEWLRAQPENGLCPDASPGTFAPRRLYGAYVRSLLNQELKRTDDDRLELIRGDVQAIDRSAPRLSLVLDRDRRLDADLAVLAVGNFPPAPPPVADPWLYDTPLYKADPWAPDALADLSCEAPVLLIGTGLTMADVTISLLDHGHTGPIYAVSRRGLLPRRHAQGAAHAEQEPIPFPTLLVSLLRTLRRASAQAGEAPGAWQPVIDSLRPFTQDVWQTMSLDDRRRFLRHLRPWWEVHRHRLPPQAADRIDAARAAGQLRIHPGRLLGYARDPAGAAATLRRRGSDRTETLRVARVVNCSGPLADYDRITHPLIRSLLSEGAARPDPLRLGLDVTGTCALLHRDGAISRRLFAVGPVTRGAFWEITAVPDIRRQCELVAQHLAALLASRAPPQAAPPAPATGLA